MVFIPIHVFLTTASWALDCAPAPVHPCPPGTPAPVAAGAIPSGSDSAAEVAGFNPWLAANPGSVRRIEAADAPAFCVRPGLAYQEYGCHVERQDVGDPSRTIAKTIQFKETRMSSGAGLSFGATPNPEARPMLEAEACRNGYLGGSPAHLLTAGSGDGPGCRRYHALANGSFFNTYTPRRRLPDGGMLAVEGLAWTVRPDGAAGSAGLQSRLDRNHWNPAWRTPLFVADENGGREILLTPVDCPAPNPSNETCATVVRSSLPPLAADRAAHFMDGDAPKVFRSTELIEALRAHAFPTMTSAIQAISPNGELNQGQIDATGNLVAEGGCQVGFQCGDAEGHRREYRSSPCASAAHPSVGAGFGCDSLPRTVLCARNDGSISMITTASADLYTLSIALRTGSGCGIDCDRFYNFDGGGSTQMAVRDPADAAHPRVSGTHATDRDGNWVNPPCGPYRAPANFLSVFGGCE